VSPFFMTQESKCQSSPYKLVCLILKLVKVFSCSCLILKLVKVELFCTIVIGRLSKLSEFWQEFDC